MLLYVVRRVVGAVATLFALSIVIFLLLRVLPGDPATAILGLRATPELLARVRHDFGLDQPLLTQYVLWLNDVLHGNLGYSLAVSGFSSGQSQAIRGTPVAQTVVQGLRVTLPLTVLGTAVAAVLGLTGGIAAAAKQGSRWDVVLSNGVLLGISAPDFYVAFLLILAFTVWLGWLPSVGYTDIFGDVVAGVRSLALPILTIGLINAAAIARMTRASLLEALNSEYVLLARARGTMGSVILLKHALRNALVPIITVIGLQLGYLFGGVIVIENMFGLPGIGRQLLIATGQRDYPTIQALVLVFAAAFIVINLAVDLIYPVLDPRIRAH
jgi:peptide/nickel transport system permease protein